MRYKITLTAVSVFCCIFLFSGLLSWKERFQPVSNAELEISASKALLLLEKSSYIFAQKGHCASCHHNTLTSMTAAKAAAKGIPAVDSFTRGRVAAMEATLKFIGNNNLMNMFVQAKFLTPYQLLGLNAEKYPANFYTDLGVDYLLSQACADGSFQAEYQRPPLESGNLHLAAICIRAIQLYAPAAKKAKVEALVTKTRAYLEKATAGSAAGKCISITGTPLVRCRCCAKNESSRKTCFHAKRRWRLVAVTHHEKRCLCHRTGSLCPERKQHDSNRE